MKTILALVAIVLAFGSMAEAQTLPNTFTTDAMCEAALASGKFRYYLPQYLGMHDKDPVDNVSTFAVPLEFDQCINLHVVGGWRFVVGKEGDKYRFRKNADLSLTLYARDDCGNPARGKVLPAPPPAPAPAPAPAPQPVPAPLKLPTDINVHVDGEVRVVHSGEVGIRFTNPLVVESAALDNVEINRGFCGKKCKWILVGAAAVAAHQVYYWWPCPPGTQRVR